MSATGTYIREPEMTQREMAMLWLGFALGMLLERGLLWAQKRFSARRED